MRSKQVAFWMWLSRILPKRLIYFCFIDVMSYATTGKYSNTVVPELTGMGALERYRKDFNID